MDPGSISGLIIAAAAAVDGFKRICTECRSIPHHLQLADHDISNFKITLAFAQNRKTFIDPLKRLRDSGILDASETSDIDETLSGLTKNVRRVGEIQQTCDALLKKGISDIKKLQTLSGFGRSVKWWLKGGDTLKVLAQELGEYRKLLDTLKADFDHCVNRVLLLLACKTVTVLLDDSPRRSSVARVQQPTSLLQTVDEDSIYPSTDAAPIRRSGSLSHRDSSFSWTSTVYSPGDAPPMSPIWSDSDSRSECGGSSASFVGMRRMSEATSDILLDVVKTGDLASVQASLVAGLDPADEDSVNGLIPHALGESTNQQKIIDRKTMGLHYSLCIGDSSNKMAVFRHCLDNDTGTHPDSEGLCIIHKVFYDKDALELLKMLAHAGADLNLPECRERGYRPLHHAVITGRLDCVRFLLQYKERAPINEGDGSGRTCLGHATLLPAGKNMLAIIGLLLEHGADRAFAPKTGTKKKDIIAMLEGAGLKRRGKFNFYCRK